MIIAKLLIKLNDGFEFLHNITAENTFMIQNEIENISMCPEVKYVQILSVS